MNGRETIKQSTTCMAKKPLSRILTCKVNITEQGQGFFYQKSDPQNRILNLDFKVNQ